MSYGSYTLENYLVNEKVITIFACIVYRFIGKPIITSVLVNVFGAMFTIVAAVLLSKVSAFIIHSVEKIIKR